MSESITSIIKNNMQNDKIRQKEELKNKPMLRYGVRTIINKFGIGLVIYVMT